MMNALKILRINSHFVHFFIIARIFYLSKLIQKTLPEFQSHQYVKEYPHLVPKSRKISMKTAENAT